MGNAEKDMVRQAIADWAAVSGITFIEDTNPITVATAASVNLRFGMNIQPGSAGYAFYPTHGDIYIDYTDGLFLSVISHEIGHALGLKHPFEDGATLPFSTDSDQYTVMSYTSRPDTLFLDVIDLGGGSYDFDYYLVFPETPQLYDIAAIQYLYGGNVDTGAGNDTYAYTPADAPFFSALWDAGGTDLIDISAFSTGGVIDLQEGRFSSIPILPDAFPPGFSGGTLPTYAGRDNLATTYGTVIENAIGGSGADKLSGNAAGNVLDGGAGADIIAGGDGNDTYIVDNSGDLVMELGSSGIDEVQSSVSYNLMQAWHVENLVLSGGSALNGSGNWLDNVITGNGAANVLDGNRGNDTLDGGAGNDTLIGGLGDDVLVWDAADGSVQGGAGTDTLRIEGGGVALDLTAIANTVITDIELIDLTGTGNNTLTLALADVLAISSTTDLLTVDGNAGDAVNLQGTWVNGGGAGYTSYTQGLATLLVDSDISVVFA